MKIFLGGESLAEQLRAAHGAVLIDDQAAVGLVAKQRLRDAEDDQRIKSAANDRQNQCGDDRAANFRKDAFIN